MHLYYAPLDSAKTCNLAYCIFNQARAYKQPDAQMSRLGACYAELQSIACVSGENARRIRKPRINHPVIVRLVATAGPWARAYA